MERIHKSNGTVWPDPKGEDYQTLAWRFRYAHDSLETIEYICAAEVMSAYAALFAANPALDLTPDKSRVESK